MTTWTTSKIPFQNLKDYFCHAIERTLVHISRAIDLFKSYNISYYINNYNFSSKHRAFPPSIMFDTKLKNYMEASQKIDWCKAIEQNIQTLEENNTWTP